MDLHLHRLDQGHNGVSTEGMYVDNIGGNWGEQDAVGRQNGTVGKLVNVAGNELGNGDVPSASDIRAVTDGGRYRWEYPFQQQQ